MSGHVLFRRLLFASYELYRAHHKGLYLLVARIRMKPSREKCLFVQETLRLISTSSGKRSCFGPENEVVGETTKGRGSLYEYFAWIGQSCHMRSTFAERVIFQQKSCVRQCDVFCFCFLRVIWSTS